MASEVNTRKFSGVTEIFCIFIGMMATQCTYSPKFTKLYIENVFSIKC